jgi:hypothetical protein
MGTPATTRSRSNKTFLANLTHSFGKLDRLKSVRKKVTQVKRSSLQKWAQLQRQGSKGGLNIFK